MLSDDVRPEQKNDPLLGGSGCWNRSFRAPSRAPVAMSDNMRTA